MAFRVHQLINMQFRVIRGLSVRQRTVVIASALFCLCISDSVGLRFLPLPNLIASSAAASNGDFSTSRSPRPPTEQTAHIVMLAGSHYRTGDRYHSVQVATHAQQPLTPIDRSIFALTRETCGPLLLRIVFRSGVSERAPPTNG